MKRKYNNQKVKPGDWVYFLYHLDNHEYETKYSYKVAVCGAHMITVEVNDNKKDSFVGGWPSRSIGNGRYWNVRCWTKINHCPLLEIE